VCGTSCINTSTDPNNCGTCGKVCASGQLCSGGVCRCGATVSFSGQVQPILTANCATSTCHGSTIKPAGNLLLTSGSAYGNLVNVAANQCSNGLKYVVPGSVSTSYLMDKLLGVNMCFGSQMPKAGSSLPTADLNTISGWICEGAPNN
jgi:hypothetical protein